MKKVTVAILSLLFLAGLIVITQAPNASAGMVSLAPGSSATALTGTTLAIDTQLDPLNGTVLQDVSLPFSKSLLGNLRVSGTLNAKVVREANGTLDFWYQVVNSGPDQVERTTHIDFSSDLSGAVSVNYLTDQGGSIAPITADRDADPGAVIGFNFASLTLTSGNTSYWYVVHTEATHYTAGATSVINGATADVDTFAPVPVPHALLLFGSGLLGLGLLGRKFRRPGSKQDS